MKKLLTRNDIPLLIQTAKEQGYIVWQEGSEVFFANPDSFDFPRTKNGYLDMRYRINKTQKMLHSVVEHTQ